MESLVLALVPYLDLGASIAVIIMLKIAWEIYQRIIAIEKEILAFKAQVTVQVEHMEQRLEKVELYKYGP